MKDDNFLFSVYTASFKKYKYWLLVFYVLSSILFLTILRINNIVENQKVSLENDVKFIEAFEEHFKFEDYLSNKHSLLIEIIRDKFKIIFTPIDIPEWNKVKSKKNEYFEKIKKSLDPILSILNYKKENKDIIYSKFELIINDITNKYSILIADSTEIAPKGWGNKKKNEYKKNLLSILCIDDSTTFLSKIEYKLDSLYSIKSIDRFKYDNFDKLVREGEKLIQFKKLYYEAISNCESEIEQEIVKIPNVNYGLSNEIILIGLPFILIVLSFYVPLLFINFKKNEMALFNGHFNEQMVPSLSVLLKRLDVRFVGFNKLKIFSNLMLNLVIPILFTILLIFLADSTVDSVFVYFQLLFMSLILILMIVSRKNLKSYTY